ncbi:MAG TPA: sialidase family protein [Acidimicrobiales bacterium]|nr:sialidase family protein [Acidimicrobiales bacterium]
MARRSATVTAPAETGSSPGHGRRQWPRKLGLFATIAIVAAPWMAHKSYGEPPAASVPMLAAPGQMAEAAVAVDPADPRHIAAAADPYSGGVHVALVTTTDGGATWSSPIVVRPPGFSKSYDPIVTFEEDGSVLVVAGASGTGRPYCHPSSVIFAAEVADGIATYRMVRDPRPDGAFVDRPGLALDPNGAAVVTWTESAGPGADCRATPIASTAMIAISDAGGPFEPRGPLPSSGFPVAFGATPATAEDGSVLVAIGEHSPDGRSRLIVTTSTDQARNFSAPTVVSEGPTPREQLAGGDGFVKAVPSLATSANGRIAVAFPTAAADGSAGPAVFEQRNGSGWKTIPPVADPGVAELLPTVVYDGAGRLWLLSARTQPGSISFVLRHYAGSWDQPATVATGPASAYKELGEMLGAAPIADGVVTAVPVDQVGNSALVVGATRLAVPAATTSTTRQRGAPSTAQTRSSFSRLFISVAAVAAGSASLAALFRRTRRRRQARLHLE